MINEKVSAYLDGECDDRESAEVADALMRDPEQRAAWSSYFKALIHFPMPSGTATSDRVIPDRENRLILKNDLLRS